MHSFPPIGYYPPALRVANCWRRLSRLSELELDGGWTAAVLSGSDLVRGPLFVVMLWQETV
jgi:hypothetical protein